MIPFFNDTRYQPVANSVPHTEITDKLRAIFLKKVDSSLDGYVRC
jgi:hypothetical protein